MILIKVSIGVMITKEELNPPLTTVPRARSFAAPTLSAFAIIAALTLSACGSPSSASTDSPVASEHPHGSHAAHAAERTEVDAAAPRLVLTHDGGMSVLDAATGKVTADLPLAGFNRVSPAGDGRHVLVSTTAGFQVLDMGSWSEPHGDHHHHFTAPPELQERLFSATKPGHVVGHAGKTALFDDGTGEVQVFTSKDLEAAELPTTQNFKTSAAHHGVAVQLANGQLVVTNGTSEARTGATLLDKPGADGARAVLAQSDECPGVHGEASAKDEAVVLGCEDGTLLIKDGIITKISSPDGHGRIGTQAGSATSSVVLGDYKTDKDAEHERPAAFSLTDTATGKLTTVAIDYSYSFRSLARGAKGEALILGTDGKLHIHDAHSGKETAAIAAVTPWEEPTEWQQPRPALFSNGKTAYVSDPAKKLLQVIDLSSGTVSATHPLPHVPNEITGISG